MLPLRSDRGVLGVLYVAYEQERAFDAGERAYALAVADRIAQALERARLFDAARRSDEQTRMLQGVTADLGGALTVLEVELVTTRSACAAVGADACLLAIVDATRTSVRYAETDAYPDDLRALLPTTIETGTSPVADVIASGASLVFETSEALVAAYPRLAGLIDHLPFRSRVFVPVGAPGAAAGVLITSSGEPGHFDAGGRPPARSDRRPVWTGAAASDPVPRRTGGIGTRSGVAGGDDGDRRGHHGRRRSPSPRSRSRWSSSMRRSAGSC